MEITYDTLLRPGPLSDSAMIRFIPFSVFSSSSSGLAPNILGFDLDAHILQIIHYVVCSDSLLATRLAKEAD